MSSRIIKKEDLTVIHNDCLRNRGLGLAARGLLITMLSISDSEEFSTNSLTELVPDAKSDVEEAIRSLEDNGYLIITDTEYIVSDEAVFTKGDDSSIKNQIEDE